MGVDKWWSWKEQSMKVVQAAAGETKSSMASRFSACSRVSIASQLTGSAAAAARRRRLPSPRDHQTPGVDSVCSFDSLPRGPGGCSGGKEAGEWREESRAPVTAGGFWEGGRCGRQVTAGDGATRKERRARGGRRGGGGRRDGAKVKPREGEADDAARR